MNTSRILKLLLTTALANMIVLPIGLSYADPEAGSEADFRQRIDRAVEFADQAVAQGRVATNVDHLPKPAASASNVDIEALARKLDAVSHLLPMSGRPSLMAFVSFSMPKASLERLVADAETYGATLVLRGLVDGNLMKTANAAHDLIGSRKVAWIIDPQAYKRFDVDSVPTYVLVRANALPHACALHECFDECDYARVSGDVTTRYALDKIASLVPGFAPDAERFSGKEVRP
jgi:conjugal transfer pilus assembly protein TrbC